MTPDIDRSDVAQRAFKVVQEVCARNGCVFASSEGCTLRRPGELLIGFSVECGGCNRAAKWEVESEGMIRLGSMNASGFHRNGTVMHIDDYETLIRDVFS